MTGTDWERVKERFEEAVRLGTSERETFLKSIRQEDPALFDEVVQLVSGYERLESSAQKFILDQDLRADFPFLPTLVRTFEAGEIISDRYQVKRFIARGGMGVVYEVYDQELGESVALKTLLPELAADPTTIELFRREIRLSRRVEDTTNVCRVFDVGRHGHGDGESKGRTDLMFLTMELLGGETLADRLKREGKIPPEEALTLVRQMANGLVSLHKVGVIHRDFKPSNVMLVPADAGFPRAVLTDFGLARTIPSKGNEQTDQGSIGPPRFTQDYAAPEQLTAEPVGAATDVFAFGVTLFEMTTGKRPFSAPNDLASLIRRFSDPPSPRSFEPDLDEQWERVILKCLQRYPGDRYQSPADAVRVLEGEEIVPEPQPNFLDQPWVRAGLYAAACLLAVALLWQIPAIRDSALAKACGWLPGSALVCPLPEDKDLAILPVENVSVGKDNRAYADGFVQQLLSDFTSLAPDPQSMCIHIRKDDRALGVSLILTGRVDFSSEPMRLELWLKDAGTGHLLRQTDMDISLGDLSSLRVSPVSKLAEFLELDIPVPAWTDWTESGTKNVNAYELYLQALGHAQQGESTLAVSRLEEALDYDLSFAEAHSALGDAFRLQNSDAEPERVDKARRSYSRATMLDDDIVSARVGLAELEAALGDHDSAVKLLRTALEKDPLNFTAQRDLAASLEALGRLSEAENRNRLNTELRPECWYTYNHLGVFYLRYGRYNEAEQQFLQVIKLAPDNRTAHHNLALSYINMGQFAEAVKMAKRALRLGSGAIANLFLGQAYYHLGCIDQAIESLETAIERDSTNDLSWAWLSDAYVLKRDRRLDAELARGRAIQLERQLLERTPDAYLVRITLAVNLAKHGESDQASRQIKMALSLAPNHTDVLFHAGVVYEITGQRSAALEVLAEALRKGYSLDAVLRSQDLRDLTTTVAFQEMLNKNKIPGSTVERPQDASAVPCEVSATT